jgi:hypothetical protein
VDTVTDIRAPPKSNKRTATEATLQEKRATDHSKRTRTDSVTYTQRLRQSLRDNRQDAAGGPLNTHNARKKARAKTNARKHLDPEPALPPGQPHPTNATSTSPMERMRTFFTRACAQTAHNFTIYQPEESSTLAIPLWRTQAGMATLLLTLKSDQWYLAVGGHPPDNPSQPHRGTLLNYARGLRHNQEVIADQAAHQAMGVEPETIEWTRAGPRRIETGSQPAAEDDESELWVSLLGIAMIHHQLKWSCSTTGNKFTITADADTALRWTTAHRRLLLNPDHTAAPWQIAATRISFR